MSASQIRQLSDEIDLKVQVGEIVAGINISNDIINGARIEITGDTNFTDDVTMDGGVIRSSTGTIENPIPYSEINLNAGTFSLGDGALTFDPINGLEVDGTVSAGNVKTGAMEGLNMELDLDAGDMTFVDGDPLSPTYGNTLVLNRGQIAFWNALVGRYLKFFNEGLVITPDVGNTGVNANTGLVLEGAVGAVKYFDFRDFDFGSGIYEGEYFTRFVSEGGVFRFHGARTEFHTAQDGLGNFNLNGDAPFGVAKAAEFNVTSSRDYKKEIEDYTDVAMDLINGTKVRSYYLNEDVSGVDPKRIGLIVQESPLEIISLIGGDSIDSYEMSSLLWKGVQELSTELTNTKQELADLKALLVANGTIPAT